MVRIRTKYRQFTVAAAPLRVASTGVVKLPARERRSALQPTEVLCVLLCSRVIRLFWFSVQLIDVVASRPVFDSESIPQDGLAK